MHKYYLSIIRSICAISHLRICSLLSVFEVLSSAYAVTIWFNKRTRVSTVRRIQWYSRIHQQGMSFLDSERVGHGHLNGASIRTTARVVLVSCEARTTPCHTAPWPAPLRVSLSHLGARSTPTCLQAGPATAAGDCCRWVLLQHVCHTHLTTKWSAYFMCA
jgi:hypothetical protein